MAGHRTGSAMLLVAALALSGCSITLPVPQQQTPDVTLPSLSGSAAPAVTVPAAATSSYVERESSVRRSAATEAAAEQLRESALEAVRDQRWRSVDDIARAGFIQMIGMDPNWWFSPANLSDGVHFDPRRPEFLVVVEGMIVAMVFHPESARDDVPDPPGAPEVRWFHRPYPAGVCLSELYVPVLAVDGDCPKQSSPATTSPWLAFVSLVDAADPFGPVA